MGPQLAMNLLTLFFFVWNCKRIADGTTNIYRSILSSREEITRENRSRDSNEKFGLGVSSRQSTALQHCSQATNVGKSITNENCFSLTGIHSIKNKCFLFKRLTSISWLENVPLDFLSMEDFFCKFLQMTRPSRLEIIAKHSANLVKRCRNFGLITTQVLSLHPDKTAHFIYIEHFLFSG